MKENFWTLKREKFELEKISKEFQTDNTQNVLWKAKNTSLYGEFQEKICIKRIWQ